MTGNIAGPPKTFGAQDRYAQSVLSYIWDNAEELLLGNADGLFLQRSLHALVREREPKAQTGQVVSILVSSGAVEKAGHALWKIVRKEVYYDEDGQPIDMTERPAPNTYGHDSVRTIVDANTRTLNQRVSTLEAQVESLTAIVLGWKGEQEPEDPDGYADQLSREEG